MLKQSSAGANMFPASNVSVLSYSDPVPVTSSCEKSEGPGGTGSIAGTVMEQFYNDDYSLLILEKPAVDEEIFIVYGDRMRSWGTGSGPITGTVSF